jgi:hypothetical protein
MLLWAAFVWGLGSDSLSGHQTSRIIGPVIEWLFPGFSAQDRLALLYTIRKSAHVFEYSVLALLSLRALWLSWRRSLLLASVFSAGVVSAMAMADEYRQGQSALRTGSGWDVLLDICGGLTAIGGFVLFQRARRGRQRAAATGVAREAVESNAEKIP